MQIVKYFKHTFRGYHSIEIKSKDLGVRKQKGQGSLNEPNPPSSTCCIEKEVYVTWSKLVSSEEFLGGRPRPWTKPRTWHLGHFLTSSHLGHISKTGSGPLVGAHGCEIMAEQPDFKDCKDQLGSFSAFLPPRHEVSRMARDRECSSCN